MSLNLWSSSKWTKPGPEFFVHSLRAVWEVLSIGPDPGLQALLQKDGAGPGDG